MSEDRHLDPAARVRDPKKLRLRYAGACISCGRALQRGESAVWDPGTRTLTCLGCKSHSVPAPPGPPPSETAGGPVTERASARIEHGAGASAAREYRRRHERRAAQLDARWGRFAPVVKAVTEDPATTRVWAQGADGERRLGAHLERALSSSGAVFLHDRRLAGRRGNIDHVVVAQSGVWVVDAKSHAGKVERRDVGGWFRTELRLSVGGRKQNHLVEGVAGQLAAVRPLLGGEDTVLHGALCFTDASWGLFAKPFRIDGVWVGWPDALAKQIAAPGPLAPERLGALAARLGALLRPA